jgi:uncharacterized protein involved in exopolysaccharide biosynthesis
MAERESQLRRQEERLDSQVAEVSEREADWQQARETWQRERLEAERIIRELLDEVSAKLENELPGESRELPPIPSLLALSRFLDNAA